MDRYPGQDERESFDRAARVDADIIEHAFGETANPEEYVPRAACEDALDRLERIVFDIGEPAALVAPPGMGKSLLLRVFAHRVAERATPIELAYGALSFEDLCEWTLHLLGERVTGLASQDLEFVLTGRELLLAIDDAASLPAPSARALSDFASHHARLHIVLAASEGYPASRMLAAFGQPLQRVHLAHPMNAQEACDYMTRRLVRWGASGEMLERLRRSEISRVLQISGGVPRRVHAAAHHVLSELFDAPLCEEEWLGAPIDDSDVDLSD